MASTEWTMIRVPRALAERLERLAVHADHAHQAGYLRLPNEYAGRICWALSNAPRDHKSTRSNGRPQGTWTETPQGSCQRTGPTPARLLSGALLASSTYS